MKWLFAGLHVLAFGLLLVLLVAVVLMEVRDAALEAVAQPRDVAPAPEVLV